MAVNGSASALLRHTAGFTLGGQAAFVNPICVYR